jgi:hypothetical protein
MDAQDHLLLTQALWTVASQLIDPTFLSIHLWPALAGCNLSPFRCGSKIHDLVTAHSANHPMAQSLQRAQQRTAQNAPVDQPETCRPVLGSRSCWAKAPTRARIERPLTYTNVPTSTLAHRGSMAMVCL